MEQTREIKSPEQLQIGDRIPAWGDDLEVKHVGPVEEISGLGLGSRVTFLNGKFAFYPVGGAITVVRTVE